MYLERLWTECAGADDELAEFLQGLIQLAASRVKARSGNERGAAKLLEKSLKKLSPLRDRTPERRLLGLRLDELLDALARGESPLLRLERP